MFNKVPVVIVAAMSKKGHVIGQENRLLWHLPEDMRRFKTLTAHHPVVMGRKTFESILDILSKPLPGRPNIVVTRNKEYDYPGIIVRDSLESALQEASALDHEEIHIGGGAQLYKQALPFVDRLFLTMINDEPHGDAVFPNFEEAFTLVESHGMRTENGISYQWVDYVRKDTTS